MRFFKVFQQCGINLIMLEMHFILIIGTQKIRVGSKAARNPLLSYMHHIIHVYLRSHGCHFGFMTSGSFGSEIDGTIENVDPQTLSRFEIETISCVIKDA